MKRILVAYDSGYGATAEAARILGRGLRAAGAEAVVLHLTDADREPDCDALVIGSPIRLGRCTPRIKRWLRRRRDALARVPVAFFFTCMSTLRSQPAPGFPVHIDPAFDVPRRPERRMTLMEKAHTSRYYLDGFLRHVPRTQPLAVAFFKGSLHLERMARRHRLIMRLAMVLMPEIRPGDYLNAAEIEAWARRIAARITIS